MFCVLSLAGGLLLWTAAMCGVIQYCHGFFSIMRNYIEKQGLLEGVNSMVKTMLETAGGGRCSECAKRVKCGNKKCGCRKPFFFIDSPHVCDRKH